MSKPYVPYGTKRYRDRERSSLDLQSLKTITSEVKLWLHCMHKGPFIFYEKGGAGGIGGGGH